MKIVVCNSGRWGSAMANYLAQAGHKTSLICSSQASYEFIQKNQYSSRLKNFPLSKVHILVPNTVIEQNTKLIIFATPVPFFRKYLQQIKGIDTHHILMCINKGIEQDTLLLTSDIVREFFPHNTIAQLGGPCFPEGLLLAGRPAAETLACKDEKIGKILQKKLSTRWFRIYLNNDLRGVCFLGAVKNVFAIIAGIIESKNLGEEALSILITRGIYEIRKLCQKLKITDSSLYGLSGLGDLVLTCYSSCSSQNKNFGMELGKKKTLEQIKKNWNGKICEGYFTTKALFEITQKHKIEAPLIAGLYGVLYKNFSIDQTITNLLARPLKSEN